MEISDELALINAVIPHAASGQHSSIRLTDPQCHLAESGLDSLDVVVIAAYLCELFDVPVDMQKTMPVDTVCSMFSFLREHGRRPIVCPRQIEDMLAA